jgi:hypothetical protein
MLDAENQDFATQTSVAGSTRQAALWIHRRAYLLAKYTLGVKVLIYGKFILEKLHSKRPQRMSASQKKIKPTHCAV